MTWISGIQRVLDYIEENLDGEIDIESLAKLAESGTYHLQRSFSLLTGMTLTEYIRQRRLTLAASDLLRGMRVIDTAIKFGHTTILYIFLAFPVGAGREILQLPDSRSGQAPPAIRIAVT